MYQNINNNVLNLSLAGMLGLGITTANIACAHSENHNLINIGGEIKIDQRLYMGDKKGDYHSGAQLREIGLDIDGTINHGLTYDVAFDYESKESKVNVTKAFVTYSGLGENLTVSAGQVSPGFCLENASSSKWIPFLERSLGSKAFSPCPGIGVSGNKWGDNYSITAAFTQPKANDTVKRTSKNDDIKRSDRWQATGRVTYVPINDDLSVLALGVSGHIQDHSNAGIEFKTDPEAKSRNTTTLLNTNNSAGTNRIIAKSHSTLDLELAGKNGPLSGEIEYQRAHVRRGEASTKTENLSFNGYHVQASYVLTGESRPYKIKSATFGQIKPSAESGAWEVSARYSFVNLNDKDIRGGSAHNSSLGLSWYANNNLRILSEYIHSKQSKEVNNNLDKRHLNSLGLRMQVVF